VHSLGLRVLYGEHAGELLDTCLEEISREAILWPQKRAFLIVPEQTKADTERRFLEIRKKMDAEEPASGHSEGNALMLVDVVSFQRMAHRILSEVGGLPDDYLDDASRTMLIHQILQGGRKDFAVLSALSDRIGFIPDVQSVLGDFLRYHVTKEKIQSLDASVLDPAFSSKMSDFALLMDRMHTRIEELGVCDQGEEMRRLSDTLALLSEQEEETCEWPLSRLLYLKDTSVWIIGFGQVRDFTPQEWDILDGLHHVCEKMTVSVCADTIPVQASMMQLGSGAFYFGRQTIFHMKERYSDGRMIHIPPRPQKNEAFAYLTQAYSNRSAEPFDRDTSAIRLLELKNGMDELHYVAGEIRRLVLTEGYRYNQISVVLCNPEVYESNLHAVFAEYGLDPFLDKRRPLSGTALMRFVTAILDLGIHGWSFRPLMSCLKSGMCHIASDDVDQFENYCLKYGLFKGYRIFHPPNYDLGKDPQGPHMMAIVERVLTPIRILLEDLSKSDTCAAKAERLLHFLNSYGGDANAGYLPGVGGQVEALSAEWLDAGDQEAALALVSSFNELVKLLRKLEGPIGDTRFTLQNFRSMLSSGMEATLSGAIPSFVDQIRISDTRRGYQKSCKVLFVVGASRNVFPHKKVNEGFLRGFEREMLSSCLQIPFPSRAKDQVYADIFTVYALLDCPEDRLYLSCPLTDEPSLLVSYMHTVFPKLESVRNPALTDHDPRLFSPSALRRYVASILAGSSEFCGDDTVRQDHIRRALPELVPDVLRTENSFCVDLPPEQMNQRYEMQVKMSVSQMEKYAACPYQHFGNYCLHLLEREIFQVQMNDIGSVLHRMLEMSLTSYGEDIRSAGQEEEKMRIHDTYLARDYRLWAKELFADTLSESMSPLSLDPAFLADSGNRIVDVAAHSLRAVFEDISPQGYVPDLLEWNIEEAGKHPVLMTLPSGRTVMFHGLIDRIDVSSQDGTFRIIDYKSGSKKVEYGSLFHGLSLQLPAYLHAYAGENPSQQPGDAGYFHLTAPMIRIDERTGKPDEDAMVKAIRKTYRLSSLDLDAYSLRKAGRYALRKMDENCRALFAGHFPVAPKIVYTNGAKTPCEYCTCTPVCGIDPSRPPLVRLAPLPKVLDDDGKKIKEKDVFCMKIDEQLSQKGGDAI
jgi:ATP-dependent helicase/nuclease subunit B